jgi:hypothetical protein
VLLFHTYIRGILKNEYICVCVGGGRGHERPLVSLILFCPPSLFNVSFLVHHLFNRDDRHLLARGKWPLPSQSPKMSTLYIVRIRCLQYQACPDVKFPFSLDTASTPAESGQIDTLCTLDYVNIPGMDRSEQGCRMVYFQTKNPNLGKFWRFLAFLGHSVNFPAIWYILCHFGIFWGHLVCFPRCGIHIVPRKIWQPWFRGRFLNWLQVQNQS